VEVERDPEKQGVGKIVLVVDDSALIRKMLGAAFLSVGFATCGEAESGEEGIEVAKQIKPDVIILDLSMPVMNGLEAAPQLRKLFPKTPIILYTLYDGDPLLDVAASQAGVTLIVPKTAPVSTLIDKAHELIGN
jgi:DNA-binding NarL/FixJ family response regulator